jgi:NAD(P)-dependent dehydrogenase (short-subunit alcohol dehydrogenase family)
MLGGHAPRESARDRGVVLGSKVVVITGSTQGLGFGYAQAFLQRGHHVVVSGRTQSGVDAAIDRLEADAVVGAGAAIGQACEVSDLAQVQALWDFAVRSFGPVDIWLHNAGYARTGVRFADTTPAEIAAMVRANVIGSMNSAQVAVAGMSAQPQGGKLFLTLGGGGATGRVVPGMAVYSTTKRAVKYFADSLVKERRKAKDDRVLVGTISPGVNITEGLLREMRALPDAERAKALRRLEFIGEHVSTTTPWIVERILAARKQGEDITWLTTGKLLGRGLGMMLGRKRDMLSRYRISEDA